MIYIETAKLLKDTASTVTTIIDANTNFEPTVGQTWVRGTFMPGKSNGISLGPEHYSEYQGLYRLDIFVTKGTDLNVANKLADEFIKAFKSQPMLTPEDYNRFSEDLVVYPGDVWMEAARYEPVWVSIPVYVSWRVLHKHAYA